MRELGRREAVSSFETLPDLGKRITPLGHLPWVHFTPCQVMLGGTSCEEEDPAICPLLMSTSCLGTLEADAKYHRRSRGRRRPGSRGRRRWPRRAPRRRSLSSKAQILANMATSAPRTLPGVLQSRRECRNVPAGSLSRQKRRRRVEACLYIRDSEQATHFVDDTRVVIQKTFLESS